MVVEGAELHPIVKEALKESEESITRVTLDRKSVLVNKSLGDVRLRTNIGVYVIAIRRENKWIFDPEKSVQMLVGDVLIGIGPKEGCKHLQKLASGGSRTI